MHVARVLGASPTLARDARESYWKRSLGGTHSPSDLRAGEQLLIACGLVFDDGEFLVSSDTLIDLVQNDPEEFVGVVCLRVAPQLTEDSTLLEQELELLISSDQRRELVLTGWRRRFDDSIRKAVGDIGEELVLSHTRRELADVGRLDLAERVARVSLLDDTLGYDIIAPSVGGEDRLLEVKATTNVAETFSIYLTRNEADIGSDNASWFVVVCRVDSIARRTGQILGWTQLVDISTRLPVDSPGGNWSVTRVELNRHDLISGVPPAIR